MKPLTLYWVEWYDAFSPNASGWELTEDAPDGEFLCVTVGFLIGETKRYLALAQTLGQDGNSVYHTMHIPKAFIKRKKRLGRIR